MQRDHDAGQRHVIDSASELTVESVHGGLPQWVTVDIVDGLVQRGGVEELAFDLLRVLLETGVGAEARARRPPKLASNPLLFPDDVADPFGDKVVVALVMGLGGSIPPAFSSGEDLDLRLGDALAIPPDVGEGIVPVRRAHENEDAPPAVGPWAHAAATRTPRPAGW